jgi:hypothetical protein
MNTRNIYLLVPGEKIKLKEHDFYYCYSSYHNHYVCLVIKCNLLFLIKGSLKSDGQHFHQYQ